MEGVEESKVGRETVSVVCENTRAPAAEFQMGEVLTKLHLAPKARKAFDKLRAGADSWVVESREEAAMEGEERPTVVTELTVVATKRVRGEREPPATIRVVNSGGSETLFEGFPEDLAVRRLATAMARALETEVVTVGDNSFVLFNDVGKRGAEWLEEQGILRSVDKVEIAKEADELQVEWSDPAGVEDSGERFHIHIRVQQRTARKYITTVAGLRPTTDFKRILTLCKRNFNCNGAVVRDPTYGEVLKLFGDQRQNVSVLLQDRGLSLIESNDQVHVHGF